MDSIRIDTIKTMLDNNGINAVFDDEGTFFTCKIIRRIAHRKEISLNRLLVFLVSNHPRWDGGWSRKNFDEDIFGEFSHAYAFSCVESLPIEDLYLDARKTTLFDMITQKRD